MSRAPRRSPGGEPLRRPVTPVQVVAIRPGRRVRLPDRLATEEPMEIRVAGPAGGPEPVAVTMRTPGHDFELAVGYLYSEGLLSDARDVAAVKYCDLPPEEEQRFNVVTVELYRALATERAVRTSTVGASCGVCGKTTIDDIVHACGPLPPGPPGGGAPLPVAWLLSLPQRLRAGQALFERTGGLHGAALFTAPPGDATMVVREDVGRHNAVDKLVGHAFLAGRLPLHGAVLAVSGRVSYEIVQKAAMAGITVIVAVSAPSSLAIASAEGLGVTLVGFVRDDRANLYTHRERVGTTGHPGHGHAGQG